MEQAVHIPDMVFVAGEVCLGFIGFTGIVSILGHRSGRKWRPEELLQLRTMIEPATAGLFGSFVPHTVRLLTQDADLLWRLSNGLMFAFCFAALVAFYARTRVATPVMSQRVLGAICAVIIVGAMPLAALGMLPRPDFVFVIGLWMAMVVAAHNFALLLFDIGVRDSEER
jgi:hypothetical protein